eukprot:TRINITY_DN5205_c0_g1_i3.p1 TRINITY_DN5205_c0_g1~~TRINITY_DN5205_c0_g1_i3.p1  ORF type:complete len:551 (+),score=99.10 TRINITY_DN5205_c0_g1_i3:88-1740(+)
MKVSADLCRGSFRFATLRPSMRVVLFMMAFAVMISHAQPMDGDEHEYKVEIMADNAGLDIASTDGDMISDETIDADDGKLASVQDENHNDNEVFEHFGQKPPKIGISKKNKSLFQLAMLYEPHDDSPIFATFANHRLPKKSGISTYTAILYRSGKIKIYDSEGQLLTHEHLGHQAPLRSFGFTGKDAFSGGFVVSGDEAGVIYFRNMSKRREVLVKNTGKLKRVTLYRYNLPISHEMPYFPLSGIIYVGTYDRWGNRIVASLHEDGTFRKFFYNGTLISTDYLSPSVDSRIIFGKSADLFAVARGSVFDIFHMRHSTRTTFSCPLEIALSSLTIDITFQDVLYVGNIQGEIITLHLNDSFGENPTCRVLHSTPSGEVSRGSKCNQDVYVSAVPDHFVSVCLGGNITLFNTSDIMNAAPYPRSTIPSPLQTKNKNANLVTTCNRSKQLLISSDDGDIIYVYELDVDFPAVEFGRYRTVVFLVAIFGFIYYRMTSKKNIDPNIEELAKTFERIEKSCVFSSNPQGGNDEMEELRRYLSRTQTQTTPLRREYE